MRKAWHTDQCPPALQMLAGGDVQRERLAAMHERILQRTIPIEEVCFGPHQPHVTRDHCSRPDVLLMRSFGTHHHA